MPKKMEKKSALALVDWVERLPHGGGAWGKGILDTVRTFEVEADAIDVEIEKLETQAKNLRDRAAQRRSMALQTARRAGREAPKLFDEAVVAKANPALAALAS